MIGKKRKAWEALRNGGVWFALDLMRAVHVSSGRLYPWLHQWEEDGRIERFWTTDSGQPRIGYRLVPDSEATR